MHLGTSSKFPHVNLLQRHPEHVSLGGKLLLLLKKCELCLFVSAGNEFIL